MNQIDIAPNYVGTLMAIGNTLGNIVTIIMPVVVSYVVQDVVCLPMNIILRNNTLILVVSNNCNQDGGTAYILFSRIL